ncbi:MAG: hypothetical protein ACLUI3_06635 [Christensenellales bacterium]
MHHLFVSARRFWPVTKPQYVSPANFDGTNVILLQTTRACFLVYA